MRFFKIGLRGRYTLIICLSVIGFIVMYSNLPNSMHLKSRIWTDGHDDDSYVPYEPVVERQVTAVVSSNSLSEPKLLMRQWPSIPENQPILQKFVNFFKVLSKPEIDHNKIENMIFEVSEFLKDHNFISGTTCKTIDDMMLYENLNRNNMDKLVNRALYDESFYVVLKSPGIDGDARMECFKHDSSDKTCDHLISYKVLREILNHLLFSHRSIAEMKGFCIRGARTDLYDIKNRGVVMVMENGNNYMSFSKRPWPHRTQALVNMATLLQFFEKTPFGSVGLEKVTLDDFADFDDMIKFVDLDEIRLGEKKCERDSDCILHDVTDIPCTQGVCHGYNAKSNIQAFCDTIFYALLENAPVQVIQKTTEILQACSSLSFSAVDLYTMFDFLKGLNYYEEDRPVTRPHPPFPWQRRDGRRDKFDRYRNGRNRIEHNGDHDNGRDREDHDEFYDNENQNDKGWSENLASPSSKSNGTYLSNLLYRVVGNYRVYVSKNMPSVNDFRCPRSHVHWGCLLEAKSVDEALRMCEDDPVCHAAAIFTKTHENGVHTVLLKNGTSGRVANQDGVDLYVHNGRSPISDGLSAMISPDSSSKTTDACLASLSQKATLRFREKRLMSHLGLNGLKEKTWLKFIRKAKFSDIQKSENNPYKFLANVTYDTPHKSADDTPVVPAVNDSLIIAYPNGSHIAHLIAYHTDRLLGLFHVAPSTYKPLGNDDLDVSLSDATFKSLAHFSQNSSLSSVITVPQPSHMVRQYINIPWLLTLPHTITRLPKSHRMQLEYVLLLWMVKMLPPTHGYLSNADHFIHFEAELSLQNNNIDWLYHYLYSCQFPLVVYNHLRCYNCHHQVEYPRCSFGSAVISALKREGLSGADIRVGDMTEHAITKHLNDFGQRLTSLITECVTKYGDDNTVY